MFEISLLAISASEGSVAEFLSAIPSPSRNSIEIGSFTIHAYGLMIGLGMIAGVAIASRRWVAAGGISDDIVRVAMWGVPAGIVGARLYHVITDWKTYADTGWVNALKITNGGLGIPGGLLLGLFFGFIAMKRLNVNTARFVDATLPAIPVAQAVGRLGNWFNQELFGRPTDLPWAVKISPENRERASIPAEYLTSETFHPTFAYEAIWNLLLAGLLITVTNKKFFKPGQSLFIWIAGYGLGRFLVESLRIDPASLVAGVRVNHWVSGLAILAGLVGFFWAQSNWSGQLLADNGSPQPYRSIGGDAKPQDPQDLETNSDRSDNQRRDSDIETSDTKTSDTKKGDGDPGDSPIEVDTSDADHDPTKTKNVDLDNELDIRKTASTRRADTTSTDNIR